MSVSVTTLPVQSYCKNESIHFTLNGVVGYTIIFKALIYG